MGKNSYSLFYLAFLLLAAPTLSSAQPAAQSPAPSASQTASQSPAQASPPAQAAGQANAQVASEPAAVLKVTTRLVVVDVIATDRKGLPLTDLKAEDFSLQEEGTEQKVRVFSFQQPSQTETLTAPVKLPANMVSNIPTYQASKTMCVLLLDGLNTDLISQKYVRQEMIKFLEKLPAGQPVAVYALGAKLRLLQDFTTDPGLMKQVIQNMKGRNSPVLDNPTGSQSAPYLTAATASALAEMGMQAMLKTDQRVSMTLAALKSLARTLSGYPGRKNLIWVSSNFPAIIFATSGGPSSLSPKNPGGGMRDYTEEIERISSALSNARVAVYPVDARTMVNHDVYSSLSNTDSNGNYLGRTASGRSGTADAQGAMGAELNRTGDELMATHSTMNTVAERTGGKAFYNTNNLDGAVREGIEDGATYYTLGYYPENKDWDGKFRRIVVNVNRPGTKLRYRQGYLAMDPKGYARLDARQQALDLGQALSLDYPLATALIFRATVAPPSEQTGNKVLVNFGVDAHAMGFELKNDGLQHASIDCAVQVFSMKGDPLQARANTFAAGLKPEQFQMVMQKFFPCNQALDLGPGDYVLRLGVRDNATGLIGTSNARVTVPLSTVAPGGGKPDEKKP